MGERSPSTAVAERAAKPRARQAGAVRSDHGVASFAALARKLDYLDAADLKLVRNAYCFADEAHLGQFRASGEP